MTFNINNSSIINFDRSSSFANVSIVNSTTTSSYLGVNDTGYPFQGTSFGYVNGRPAGPNASAIDRFPFVADGSTATSHGSLSVGRYWAAGQSSDVSGYTSGGIAPGLTTSNVIDKFPFSSNSGSSDVGDLTIIVREARGHSSKTHGYTSGGSSPPLTPLITNVIQKFPFATDANATDVGDLLSPIAVGYASHSSTVSGYAAGGFSPTLPAPTIVNVIQKFPFATDANATDVGDLTVARGSAAGHSSPTDGFTSGGSPSPSPSNVIDKFPFATDANATDVGDMSISRSDHGGLSTTTHGYITGGSNPSYNLPGNPFNTVDRFSFSGSGFMTSGTHNLTVNSAGPHATQQD